MDFKLLGPQLTGLVKRHLAVVETVFLFHSHKTALEVLRVSPDVG